MSISLGTGGSTVAAFLEVSDDGRHTSDGSPMNLTDNGQGTMGYFFKALPVGSETDTSGSATFWIKDRVNSSIPFLNRRTETWMMDMISLTAPPGIQEGNMLLTGRMYTYDGTYNLNTNSTEITQILTPDKWYFSCVTWEYFSGTVVKRVYDCDTGALITQSTAATAVPENIAIFTEFLSAGTNRGALKLSGYTNNVSPTPTVWGRIAEYCQWNVVVPEAELQALSQTGFADINRPDNLIYDYNFMIDWTVTGANTIENRAKNYAPTLNATANILTANMGYSVDNPVEVLNIIQVATEHDSITFNLFSAFLGTAYYVVKPSSSPAPTESEIVADPDSMSLSYPTSESRELIVTGLTTGESMSLYLVVDTGGSYSSILQHDFTTPTKYSEIITDVTGAEVTEQSGIQWAWFDEENPSTLSSPSTQGVAELTDATGLLEITLPTSISTPKGSKGTMVLRADWGGGVQTASHVAEVK